MFMVFSVTCMQLTLPQATIPQGKAKSPGEDPLYIDIK